MSGVDKQPVAAAPAPGAAGLGAPGPTAIRANSHQKRNTPSPDACGFVCKRILVAKAKTFLMIFFKN